MTNIHLPVGGLLGLTTTHATTMPDVSVGHVLAQTVIVLILIVGGLWTASKVYARKRAGKLFSRGANSNDGLRVISRHPLGKDQQLAVIMWGERKILIGVSGSNISFFNDGMVDDGAIASALAGQPTPAAPTLNPNDTFGDPASAFTIPSGLPVGSLLSPGAPTTSRGRNFLEKLRDATQRN